MGKIEIKRYLKNHIGALYWLFLSFGLTLGFMWPYWFLSKTGHLIQVLSLLIIATLTGSSLFLGYQIFKEPSRRKFFIFTHIATFSTVIILLILLEAMCSFFVPPWPDRDLRPYVWKGPTFNSWGMRDRERHFQKGKDVFRAIFVGDSFLEGIGCPDPLTVYCERQINENNMEKVECLNLGVSATGPKQYYYRYKEIGKRLDPDAVFLFFFLGNDFLFPADRDSTYSSDFLEIMTNFIAEKPKPSLVGFLLPRLNWLLVNKFRISEFAMGNKPIFDESKIFSELCRLPKEKGLNGLARHMKKHYFPFKDAIHVENVLNRGDGRLWDVVQPREKDQEGWVGWQFENLLEHEFRNTETLKDPPWLYDSIVSTTISWLEPIHNLCRKAHIPFVVFLIPVASDVDPEYVDFWSPWPAFLADLDTTTPLAHKFKRELKSKGIIYVDLGNQLGNIGATYRKMDGHWTEKGHEIVSHLVVNELEKLIGN